MSLLKTDIDNLYLVRHVCELLPKWIHLWIIISKRCSLIWTVIVWTNDTKDENWSNTSILLSRVVRKVYLFIYLYIEIWISLLSSCLVDPTAMLVYRIYDSNTSFTIIPVQYRVLRSEICWNDFILQTRVFIRKEMD